MRGTIRGIAGGTTADRETAGAPVRHGSVLALGRRQSPSIDASAVSLREQILHDVEIGVPARQRATLGPHLKLSHCSLAIGTKAQLKLGGVIVNDSRVESAGVLRCSFERTQLTRAVFSGLFVNCKFGPGAGAPSAGSVRDCDFRAARLQLCEFSRCDLGGTQFGSWPSVVIANPRQNERLIRSAPWPDHVKVTALVGLLVSAGISATAFAFDAELLSAQLRIDAALLRRVAASLRRILLSEI